VCDAWTNLLRNTTEAFSAVLGGCDVLTVRAFHYPERLAENVQLVLKEEAHLDKVTDPAGGSYYIEALTNSLACAAWKLFQQIEGEGGYSAAKAAGTIDKAIAEAQAAKVKAVNSRRRAMVGVNNYPNMMEQYDANVETAPDNRLAVPFEKLQARTARHAAKTGKRPRIVLLTRGDVKMRMARAQFCLNFIGCAGFEVVESAEYENAGADILVLCSSDPEYVALAAEVCPKVQVPVIVAGNPKEQIEELQKLGVAGFVHVQSNAVELLTGWQDRLGMEA
jgi:methylmalonyl-CoA mutase